MMKRIMLLLLCCLFTLVSCEKSIEPEARVEAQTQAGSFVPPNNGGNNNNNLPCDVPDDVPYFIHVHKTNNTFVATFHPNLDYYGVCQSAVQINWSVVETYGGNTYHNTYSANINSTGGFGGLETLELPVLGAPWECGVQFAATYLECGTNIYSGFCMNDTYPVPLPQCGETMPCTCPLCSSNVILILP